MLEETDESHYWLTIIKEAGILDVPLLHELIAESNEVTAKFAATDKTAKSNKNKLDI